MHEWLHSHLYHTLLTRLVLCKPTGLTGCFAAALRREGYTSRIKKLAEVLGVSSQQLATLVLQIPGVYSCWLINGSLPVSVSGSAIGTDGPAVAVTQVYMLRLVSQWVTTVDPAIRHTHCCVSLMMSGAHKGHIIPQTSRLWVIH